MSSINPDCGSATQIAEKNGNSGVNGSKSFEGASMKDMPKTKRPMHLPDVLQPAIGLRVTQLSEMLRA